MRALSLLFVLLFPAGVAMADDKALDVTIRVLESPVDLPSAVTKTIQLPPAAAQKARENPAAGEPEPGSGNRDESRNRGKGPGSHIAGENQPGKGKGKNKEKKNKKKD